VVIIFERSPFLPTLTVGTRQDAPDMGDDQGVTAAFFAGKLKGIIIIHGCIPSVKQD
jgi:hypothetical protein